MVADSWGSFEQSVDLCHDLGRESQDWENRNRSDPSHSVGFLNMVGFLPWCYLVNGVLCHCWQQGRANTDGEKEQHTAGSGFAILVWLTVWRNMGPLWSVLACVSSPEWNIVTPPKILVAHRDRKTSLEGGPSLVTVSGHSGVSPSLSSPQLTWRVSDPLCLIFPFGSVLIVCNT